MNDNDLFETIKRTFTSASVSKGINLFTSAVSNAVSNVLEFDNSLQELQKTSGLSSSAISEISDKANELGENISKSGSDILNAITAFKNAGYEIADSMEYAEEALKTTNISNNIKDTSQAVSSLISIMKGFQDESPDFAGKINDAVSNVANTQSIDFDTLISGAVSLSDAAGQAGLSFEQMLGILTGGYQVLGNMEEVVSGQIDIFSRLQAVRSDGSYDPSAVEGLQDILNSASNGAVNIVDQSTGQLRDVYEILDDTAEIWNQLDNNTRDAIASEAAGSSQKDVFNAMMQNWQNVETAVEAAKNSLGSSDKLNENYINSVQGQIDGLEASLNKLSQTLINSDMIKFFVEFGTNAASALDTIIDKVGLIPVAISAIYTATNKSGGLINNSPFLATVKYNSDVYEFCI